jgi:hypothetical protein
MKGDFRHEGVIIFSKDQTVQIRDISADPQRPGFKYVVYSEALGALVRLPGTVLIRITCPNCRTRLNMIGSDCPNCGWSDPENEHAKTQESIQEFKTRMQSRRGRYGGGYYGW